jgi:hypothetical protein
MQLMQFQSQRDGDGMALVGLVVGLDLRLGQLVS